MRSAGVMGCVVLLGLAGAAQAGTDINVADCSIQSPYSLRVGESSLRFERKDAPAHSIEIGAGGLRLNDQAVSLSSTDQARLVEFEREARALIPEAKSLALEAIDIAFRALEQVGLAFAGDNLAKREQAAEKLATGRMLISRRIEDGFNGREPMGADLIDELIGDSVVELMPIFAGEIVSMAVTAALSGDEAAARELEARVERMEADLEREMEARGKAIEASADALCQRVAALDEIESSLSRGILDGEPLDLIRLDGAP